MGSGQLSAAFYFLSLFAVGEEWKVSESSTLMTRRDFAASLIAGALPPASVRKRPRMLIAIEDPFSGLPLLRVRYAAGQRPSDDMAGWALTWLITEEERFAEQAVSEMKIRRPPAPSRPSRSWVDYVQWALAFDWLYAFRGFDSELKNRIANELGESAATVAMQPELRDPDQVSYHNFALRYLAFVTFATEAIAGHGGDRTEFQELREHTRRAFENVLELTQLVTPEGSYHESMDYMRITWAPLALLAELHRTQTGWDPARRYSVFRNFGDTYLYKLLPNGTPSREGDNEYPLLDTRDTAAIGYAVHRFKDPYSAWLLRKSGFFANEWVLPVLQFLWDDPEVVPQDPAVSSDLELPRQRYFPGVGHLVIRNGWNRDSTWIEFDCGAYFAKHQHLDQNQFTIYHKGYLAIDSGADYTDTESPHYLNYYRRTVAHNSVLVYEPGEQFFWSENMLPAANDGGQRMDSSRFWNTIRSVEDWQRTEDLWNLGRMRPLDSVPGLYHYALGDATRSYSPQKIRRFTRELLYAPKQNVLFVFDRVVSTNPNFRKAWLLHGVNEPVVNGSPEATNDGGRAFANARGFRLSENGGELIVHVLLPRDRALVCRGGSGSEFWTPGDDRGGAWGSGQNWPLDAASGGPLPSDPKLRHMWKTFWGEDFDQLKSSNRKNVIPGAWRVEVSPTNPAEEDVFLNVIEIGDHGATTPKAVELLEGVNLSGAIVPDGMLALFSTGDAQLTTAEVTIPDLPFSHMLICGLFPDAVFELHFTGPNESTSKRALSPGVPIQTMRERSNANGILLIPFPGVGNARLRLTRAVS